MNRFDERAATWDDKPSRVERARVTAEAIASRLPLAPDWSVVEVGSGTGLLSRLLGDRIGDVVLVDTSQGMTDTANATIAATGTPRMRAVCLDITAEPAPGGPFDLALSLMMLHHVADAEGFVEAVVAQLAPGGYLAFADVAAEDGSFHDDPEGDGVHHHGFSPERLREVAEAAGLVEVAVEEIHQLEKERDGSTRLYGLLLVTGRVPVTVTAV